MHIYYIKIKIGRKGIYVLFWNCHNMFSFFELNHNYEKALVTLFFIE